MFCLYSGYILSCNLYCNAFWWWSPLHVISGWWNPVCSPKKRQRKFMRRNRRRINWNWVPRSKQLPQQRRPNLRPLLRKRHHQPQHHQLKRRQQKQMLKSSSQRSARLEMEALKKILMMISYSVGAQRSREHLEQTAAASHLINFSRALFTISLIH